MHEKGESSFESPNIIKCVSGFEHHKDAHGAVECIRDLKRLKEFIVWDGGIGRLKCMAEIHDKSWATLMEELTKALDIKDRAEWVMVKDKYNLTMY